MKYILWFIFVSICFSSQAQNSDLIQLTNSIKDDRLGVWTNGDYKVFIDLNEFEISFNVKYQAYLSKNDSINVNDSFAIIYNLSAKRFLETSQHLNTADNGFDLNTLVVYYGPENHIYNIGNSPIIEQFITQFVENGNGIVFYKGKRMDTLQRTYEYKGEGLDFGYLVWIFANDKEQSLFNYFQHLGW
jgi:hypothetical protein